jgi:hypothetical protein
LAIWSGGGRDVHVAPDGVNLGVRYRVVMLGNLIAPRRQGRPVPSDDATDGRKRRIRTVLYGDPERLPHKFFVVAHCCCVCCRF